MKLVLNKRFFSFDALVLLFVVLFAIGMVCSKFLLSISMLSWLLTCLLHGDFSTYFKRIKNNLGFLIILLFYAIHLLSMLWTQDLDSGWDGIRVRTTLLLIPMLFTISFSLKGRNIILINHIVIASVAFIALLNLGHYYFLTRNFLALDIRQLSWFGSHIRFGVLASFSVAIAYFNFSKKNLSPLLFWIFVAFITYYTLFSQVFSAYLALAIVGICIVYARMALKGWTKYFWIFLAVTLISFGTFLTLLLNPNHAECGEFKNFELANKEWNARSEMPLGGLDKKNQPLQSTTERYMCSKSIEVNETNIRKLSATDIQNIENGFADEYQANNGFFSRISEIKYQLYEAKNPNGHSLLQRIEYWKTATFIVSNHFFAGVGIGDIDQTFGYAYKERHSPLSKEYQARSHNMFLTTWIGTGLVGITLFVLLFIVGFYQSVKRRSWLLFVFMLVSLLTMFFEDSLETQAGVSFFAFYYSFLLLGNGRIIQWSLKNN